MNRRGCRRLPVSMASRAGAYKKPVQGSRAEPTGDKMEDGS